MARPPLTSTWDSRVAPAHARAPTARFQGTCPGIRVPRDLRAIFLNPGVLAIKPIPQVFEAHESQTRFPLPTAPALRSQEPKAGSSVGADLPSSARSQGPRPAALREQMVGGRRPDSPTASHSPWEPAQTLLPTREGITPCRTQSLLTGGQADTHVGAGLTGPIARPSRSLCF